MRSLSATDVIKRRLLAAGLLLAGLRLAAAQSRGPAKVKFELDLPQRGFILRELMPMQLRLRNDGSAAATVPRLSELTNATPVFTVEGPSFTKPFVFSPRNGLPPEISAAALATVPTDTEVLAPGQAAEETFDLGRLVPFTQAGTHTVRAQVTIEGSAVASNILRVEVAKPRFLSARLMLDDGFQRTNVVRTLCLVDNGRERALYMALFREIAPDYARTELMYLLRVAAADGAADEALPTWTNYPRNDTFVQRYGWRSPSQIGIEGSQASQRATAADTVDPAAPRVQPALLQRSGAVEVFQLRAGALALWQFAAPAAGAAAGRQLWQLPLPAQQTARAARGPAARGERPAAVLASRSATGVLLTLVESVDSRPQTRQVELRSARLLPASEPALHVDAEGRIHAALVVAADNALRRVHCAQVTWPAGNGAGRVQDSRIVELPAAPVAAAAAFDTGGGARRAWVAQLPDGRMHHGDAAAFAAIDGKPLLPLQLLLLGPHTYVLVQDAGGALALAAVS